MKKIIIAISAIVLLGAVAAAIAGDLYAGTPSYYSVAVATNTVTNLNTVASFTVPCALTFDHQGLQFTGAAGAASATVGVGIKRSAGDKYTVYIATTTYNIGIIASGSVSRFAVEAVPLTAVQP